MLIFRLYMGISGVSADADTGWSYEMLLSDSVDVAAKAREQGVKVRISIYEGMFHIFQMAAKMLPESKRAWVEIGKFIDVLLND